MTPASALSSPTGWSSSGEHDFQQDFDHPSRNPHKPVSDLQFTHSCE